MKYKKFLLKPVFFIVALLTGSWLVLYVEKLKPSDVVFAKELFEREVIISRSKNYPIKEPVSELTAEEQKYAEVAWEYFKNNYNDQTGFVSSVENSEIISMKDAGDWLMALLSAYEIGIIDSMELDEKLTRSASTLSEMSLYNDQLPNKYYNVTNFKMLTKTQKIADTGIGWSSLDIGRFLSAMIKINFQYPRYQGVFQKAVRKWKLDTVIMGGFLYEGKWNSKNEKVEKWQEGTLGMEEYAAKGFYLSGWDVSEALIYTDFLKFRNIFGQEIAIDTRVDDKSNRTLFNYLHSDPYILDGLEYGWDVNSRELAWRIFKVQEARYKEKGILTAVSEDYVDGSENYVCNAIYANGENWVCLNQKGREENDSQFLSTKAAFGYYSLYDHPYARALFNEVKHLYDPNKGWYSGKYEKSGKPNKSFTASTNSMVLEAMNYRLHGRLIKISGGK